ncbi:MAG: molybdate ABC transporter substrate-binding protein [Burkholderiaceae bacterium]
MRRALDAGDIRRFAIANPEHAPYGRAARAVLRHAGLWSRIEPLLVLGENASQALQFAASGSSQGGIVPLSLSKAPPVAALGRFATIPADWHAGEPLRQRMVLTRHAGAAARAFYDYLQGPAARAILARYGFALPGEPSQ